MKKTILIICSLLASTGVFAQFEQGTMLVGGNVGYSGVTYKYKSGSTSTTVSKTSTISVMPQFGYFIMDNLAVGAGLNISSSTEKSESSDEKYTSSSMQLTPFARYYFGNIFAIGQFGFGSSKDKQSGDGSTTEQKYGVTSWAIGAGYAAMLNDNVAIEPSLLYGSQTEKLKDADPVQKDIYSGFIINIAFQIYLR